MYQKILEESSFTVLTKLESIIAKLCENSEFENNLKLKLILYLELNQVYLTYGRVQKSEECLDFIKNHTGFELELKGINIILNSM